LKIVEIDSRKDYRVVETGKYKQSSSFLQQKPIRSDIVAVLDEFAHRVTCKYKIGIVSISSRGNSETPQFSSTNFVATCFTKFLMTN